MRARKTKAFKLRDAPLLHPVRLIHAAAWWPWYVIECYKQGKEPNPNVKFWQLLLTYRRAEWADKRGLY